MNKGHDQETFNREVASNLRRIANGFEDGLFDARGMDSKTVIRESDWSMRPEGAATDSPSTYREQTELRLVFTSPSDTE